MIHPLKEQGHGSLMGVCPRARRREWTASVSVTEAQDPFQNSFSSMCTGRRRRLAPDSSVFIVTSGGAWLCESLELCDALVLILLIKKLPLFWVCLSEKRSSVTF